MELILYECIWLFGGLRTRLKHRKTWEPSALLTPSYAGGEVPLTLPLLTILFTVSWVKLTRRSTLAISTCGTTTSSFSSSKNLSTMSSRITTTSLLSSGKGSGLASSISPVPGFSATTTSYSASSKILSSSSFPSTIGYSS